MYSALVISIQNTKGNEYHTICWGESGIIYGWEIVEGRDHPIPIKKPEFKTSSDVKMVGLMLRLTIEIRRTEKAVIMVNILCVLKGIAEMRKRGVYGSALIKRDAIWPRGVHGDGINE